MTAERQPGEAQSRPLDGQVALITGAGGQIGRATAALLTRRGARIVAVDHPAVDWTQLRAALSELEEPVLVSADVTRESDVRAYVEAALAVTGRIDIFFNNAGIEGPQLPIPDYPVADFRRVLEVNVTGVFLGLQAVMPVMLAQRSGSIINTSSIAGMRGNANMAGYVASKHAVVGLTRAAARESGSTGVRINSLHPGLIESRMLSDIARGLNRSASMLSGSVPMGRLGTPEEVAKAVAFLASDESSYMNGSSLVVDGGYLVG